MARALGEEAARAGWVVVSGLARGVDSAAHEACLAANGTTWAVLGSGLGRIYPAENAALARRIVASGGCVISEYDFNEPPLDWHFPRRNRIVAGLCWATIVVEGGENSGALITARRAVEIGRDVFAVPGPADSPYTKATFILLKEGAAPLRTLDDAWPFLEKYMPCAPSTNTILDEEIAPASLLERKIVQCLGSETRTLEELGQAAALDIVRLSTILLDMELNGFIQSLPGQRYAKKRNH
jgi:DNA processing protein